MPDLNVMRFPEGQKGMAQVKRDIDVDTWKTFRFYLLFDKLVTMDLPLYSKEKLH